MPGKIVAINGTKATVDFDGNKVDALFGPIKIKIGDYVLVHAGCILQIMSKDEGEGLVDLLREIDELQTEQGK